MLFNPDDGNNASLFDFVVVHLARWFGAASDFPLMQFNAQMKLHHALIDHRAAYEAKYYEEFPALGIELSPLPYPFRLSFINDMLDAWGYPTQDRWTAEFFADYIDPPELNAWLPLNILPSTFTIIEVLFFPRYSITGMLILEMQRVRTIDMLVDAYNVGSGGAGGRVGP